MRVYLDTCCYNRPFDDQSQERIRLEARAVDAILDLARTGQWTVVGSEAIDDEISQIPLRLRRIQVEALVRIAQEHVLIESQTEQRARDIQALGFSTYDALHLACSESARVDAFLTTDDSVLRRASRNRAALHVEARNPVQWLLENLP